MATNSNNAVIEEFPVQIEEFPVQAAPTIEEFSLPADSPEVAAAAQNSATVAGQALDVATLPSKMDWRAANEHLDQQRFADVLDLQKQADTLEAQDPSQALNPRSASNKLRTQAFSLQQQMTPETQAAQNAAELERGQRARSLSSAAAAGTPKQTFQSNPFGDARTPSEALTNLLGPGISQTVVPIAEGAARGFGGATGGAAGAALGTAATMGVMGPLGLVPLIYGIGGAILGQHAGSAVQEKILQIGETPLETEQRQQRAAEDYAANPGLSKIGAAAANLPFFGPSLAQFARAGAGDIGAIRNISIGGALGGGLEAAGAKLRGETPNLQDVAEATFLGAVMNEPTALGRKLGLHPSSEQAAVEAAQKAYGVKGEKLSEIAPEPIGPQPGEPNAQQVSETSPPDGGVRAPEVTGENVPLPAAQGGEGVQPSGQGRSLAENAPEAPREVSPRKIGAELLQKGVQRAIDESKGQAVLDRLTEEGKSPQTVVKDFWKDTFPYLSESQQQRFTRMVKDVTGSKVGDVISTQENKKTGEIEKVTAKNWNEVFPPEATADSAAHLEGTERGLIALMESANQGMGRMKQVKETVKQLPDIQSEAAKVGPIRYDGVTQMGEDGFYSFTDSESKPGTAISFTVESKTLPTAEQIAEKHTERLKAFGVEPIPLSPQTDTAPAPPSSGEPAAQAGDSFSTYTPEQQKALLADAEFVRLREAGDLIAAADRATQILAPETSSAEPTTSIKNAVTAEERAARGIPPAEEVIPRGQDAVWDAATKEIADNPSAPEVVLADLRKKARPLSDREDALILHKQNELELAYDRTAAELNAAAEAGDEPARVEAQTRLNNTRDALTEVYDLGKQGGTETARGLAFRKVLLKRNYTLARQEARLLAEHGGKVSDEKKAEILKFVQEKVATIEKTQQTLDTRLAEAEAKQQRLESLKELDPAVRTVAERVIAKLDAVAANSSKELKRLLKQQLQNLSLNPIPNPKILLHLTKIAAAKSAKGAIKFAQWSADVIAEFGETVKPYLQTAWDQRDQHIDSVLNTEVTGKRTVLPRSEESKAKARKTYLATKTKEYLDRLEKGDFAPRKRKPLDLRDDPEYVRSKSENEQAKAALDKAAYEARMQQRSRYQKVKDFVANTWGASRPILASTDFSAPGRQGAFFALPDLFLNPKRLNRQIRSMLVAQFSEQKFHERDAQIKSRENADIYEQAGLYLADIDHKPSTREESFKSELAEKVPGVGRVVRGSNRGFTTAMNTIRADALDSFILWSGGREKVNADTAKFLAEAVNDLAGRGNVTSRQAAGAMEWLAKYLFSPRLWVSRFNTAILKPIWRDPFNTAISPRARAVVFGQYAKFIGAVSALGFLAKMWGGKVDEDPRSSDFGKLQFGSKRYDVSGGIGNMITLLARIASRQTKDDKGRVLRIAWQDEKRPERELGQILFQHLRNKAAPVPGAIYDYIYGRHPDRSKVTAGSMLKQTVVPITVSDTLNYFQKESPAGALRDTLINSLGIPVNDYSK